MPNCCITNYVFYPAAPGAKEKKALNDFKKVLETVMKLEQNEVKSVRALSPYIGRILKSCNIGDGINCGGSFSVESDTKVEGLPGFKLYTETVWSPMPEVFSAIINKCYCDETGPLVKMLYQAEESSCGLYVTNDKEGIAFPEQVKIDICIEEKYLESYADNEYEAMEEFDEFFDEELGWTDETTKPSSFEEWVKFFEEEAENDGDGYAAIDKFDIEETPNVVPEEPFTSKGEYIIFMYTDERILKGEVKEIAKDGKITISQGEFIKSEHEAYPGKDGIILESFRLEKEK